MRTSRVAAFPWASFLTCLAFFLHLAPGQAQNLIPNPSFEEITPGGGSAYWSPWVAAPPASNPLGLVKADESIFSLDGTVAKYNAHSAKISSPQPVRASFGIDRIPIQAGQKLHYSAWMKGEGLDAGPDGGAWVRFGFTNEADPAKHKIAYAASGFLKAPAATFDWTFFEGDVTVPPEAAQARIELFLWNSKGTVWFDGVSIERVDGPENPPGALADPSQRERYRAADDALPAPQEGEKRVVFFGDSITDNWKLDDSFPGRGFINRGIGGQRTNQLLDRFGQDVQALKPKVVWLLVGTNDIASGSSSAAIAGNIRRLVQACKENRIAVVVSSLLPVCDYHAVEDPKFKRTGLRPLAKIVEVNRLVAALCGEEGVTYLDLHAALADASGQLPADLTADGVHPNAAGYARMAPLVLKAIDSLN